MGFTSRRIGGCAAVRCSTTTIQDLGQKRNVMLLIGWRVGIYPKCLVGAVVLMYEEILPSSLLSTRRALLAERLDI
jgi:hypothetical protein